MKLQQLSVFLENKPGQLKSVCQTLAEAHFNISTLSLADTKQYGILRLLLKDWEPAQALLQQAGFVAKLTEVLAIEVKDQPGGLLEILLAIEEENLNVEYMYAFTFGKADRAVLIFRFDDPDTALAQLKARKVHFVESVHLFK